MDITKIMLTTAFNINYLLNEAYTCCENDQCEAALSSVSEIYDELDVLVKNIEAKKGEK